MSAAIGDVSDAARVLTRDGHLSLLAASQLCVGDLDAAARDAAEAHVRACAACAGRVRQLQDEHEELVFRHRATFSRALESARDRAHPPAAAARPRATRWWAGTGGLAAAAIALVWLGVRSPERDPVVQVESAAPVSSAAPVRAKGGAALRLAVHADRPGGSVRLLSDDVAHAGERLGFRIESGRAGYLMVVGVDDRGEAYLGYPRRDRPRAVWLADTSRWVTLDQAIVLDDEPGAEHLLGLVCAEPFEFETVAPQLAAWVRSGADERALPVPGSGCQAAYVRVRKVAGAEVGHGS